jgi:hypothetical protein
MLAGGDIPARVMLDAEGRVAGDLACRHCGYNLRTLHKGAKCPECGAAVEQSWRGDWLVYSDPAWLEKIAKGLKWILSVILLWLLSLAASLIAWAIISNLRPGPRTVALSILSVANGLLVLAAIIGCGCGLWDFTTPEPNRQYKTSGIDVRRLIRVSGGVSLSAVAVGLFWRASSPAASLWNEGTVCACWCTAGAILIYLRELAMRVPDEKEASATRLTLVGLVIGAGCTILGTLGTLSLTPPDCLSTAGACVDLIVVVACLLMFNRFHRLLNDVADQSRRRIAAEAATEGGATASGQV